MLRGTVVRPEGLEPPAYWFEANRSIQLSYGRGSSSLYVRVARLGVRPHRLLRHPVRPDALLAACH